jgi:hypothetical protein
MGGAAEEEGGGACGCGGGGGGRVGGFGWDERVEGVSLVPGWGAEDRLFSIDAGSGGV